jgi:hypothetical protein
VKKSEENENGWTEFRFPVQLAQVLTQDTTRRYQSIVPDDQPLEGPLHMTRLLATLHRDRTLARRQKSAVGRNKRQKKKKQGKEAKK